MYLFGAAGKAVWVSRTLTGAMVATAMVASAAPAAHAQGTDWPNQTRVQQLVASMTLDEKLSFVSARTDPEGVGAAGYIPGVPRLGIPPLRLTDGPAGVRLLGRSGSTALPAPVQLASSFNDQLAADYGAVMGRDARAWGLDVLLGPMVNLIRVPQGGRNFETFSEDPLLTSRMGAAETKGIQDAGTIATVKHFAENNQENNRANVDVHVDEQTLREMELPAYEAAVKAGAGALMCSYNSVNGLHSCANDTLLKSILKSEWGFGGWVMSDWGATHAPTDLLAGLDQEMYNIGANRQYMGATLKTEIEAGRIPVTALDGAAARILGQMTRFGLLDGAATNRPQRDATAAAKVAQSVAEQGAVLLKSTSGALPLDDADKSIAVICPTGKTPKVGGGGSAHVVPESAASPLDTITQRAGAGATVQYATGIDLIGTPIPVSALSPAPPLDANGSAVVGSTPLSYNGTLTIPIEGDYTFVFTPPSYGPLSIDGQGLLFCILEACSGTKHLTAGPHSFSFSGINVGVAPAPARLTWIPPAAAAQNVADAVALAKQVQTPIVFGYDDGTEGADRATLALPGAQNDLINAVADANPNTIVVLNTGSSITMPWLDKVKAVLDMYYPGQNGAEATARLLYGDVNPSGKLTQTFPVNESQAAVAGNPLAYPGVANLENYSEGIFVGYRFNDKSGTAPLFPFGFGLSYTTFGFANVAVGPRSGGGVDVSFDVTNTGSRAGTEVPQVYVGPGPDVGGVQQAVRALGGYERITLAPGQTKRVSIPVDARSFQYWSTTSHGWVTNYGPRTVQIGNADSASRLPLSASFTRPRTARSACQPPAASAAPSRQRCRSRSAPPRPSACSRPVATAATTQPQRPR
jgi:beta-glucosidase